MTFSWDLGRFLPLTLQCLDFDIAKKLLRSSSVQLSLDQQVIEDICLSCSQEFYDNATSGNYHFGDMKQAYDWYVPYLLSDWCSH